MGGEFWKEEKKASHTPDFMFMNIKSIAKFTFQAEKVKNII